MRSWVTIVQIAMSGCSLLVAIGGLAVVVIGGLFGTYVVMQTKAATTDVSTTSLATEVSKMSAKLDVIADDVKELANANTAQSAKLDAHDKAISQNENQIGILASKISVVENKVATLQAQVQK